MYKRLAVIAVLMGLPIFMQPSSTADSEIDAFAEVSVASTTVTTTAQRATTVAPTTVAPSTTMATTSTTAAPTTVLATTSAPTAAAPTTSVPTTTSPIAAAPITAAPTTTPVVDFQARGQAALATIGYNWQENLPGWTITFSPGRDGVIGYTYTNEHRIEIFVRDSISDSLLRHVIAHEIGHAVDVSLNSSDDRTRWQKARDIGGSPWWPGNGVSDYSTGAGDFAESFAAWQVGSGNFRSKIGSAPTGDQMALLAELAG